MIIIAGSDKCLVGNRFAATCKRKPIVLFDKSFGYERYIVILCETARCQIGKECNKIKESIFISRLQRVFKIVETRRLEKLSINIGSIKCDNCLEVPSPKSKRRQPHTQPTLTIDRIDKYPAIAFIEDQASSNGYAQALDQIISVNNP